MRHLQLFYIIYSIENQIIIRKYNLYFAPKLTQNPFFGSDSTPILCGLMEIIVCLIFIEYTKKEVM